MSFYPRKQPAWWIIRVLVGLADCKARASLSHIEITF
jgi:hypothetical protein